MEYMILLHSEEMDDGPAPGTPEFEEMMGAWMAYNQRLIDGGHWIGGASLTPAMMSTTIAKTPDANTVTDGPFIETKEVLGGYYTIKAADLDEAIELATAVPIHTGHVEVRPVAFRPDADHG